MKLLVQNGVDINCQTKNGGNSALHYASAIGHKENVEFLLEQPGIDINLQDINGKKFFTFRV